MTISIRHSASTASTNRPWSTALSLTLASLLLTACGGSDSSGAASVTAQDIPPCGIEGSGARVQDCTSGPQIPPEPATGLSMTTARAMHTATTLGNGQVLIVGGFGYGFSAVASAEIYDPSKGTFSSTGNLNTPRGGHVAALLADGRVLVVGGQSPDFNGKDFVASAEIYDSLTGTFTPTGNMISSGRVSSAVLLPDGRVFVSQDGANAEIYDPTAGTFTLTGAYGGSTLQVDKATLLSNGLILVVGCTPICNFGAGASALFDPKANAFRPTGLQFDWDSVATTTLLADGTVVFVEGDDSQMADAVELYDPLSGTFSSAGYIQDIGMFSTATRLPDGSVLIAGGQLGGNGTAAVERYVPTARSVFSAAGLAVGRHSHTATLLPDGSVLLAGGFSGWPYPTASAEIYK